jgi:hypothetical protein
MPIMLDRIKLYSKWRCDDNWVSLQSIGVYLINGFVNKSRLVVPLGIGIKRGMDGGSGMSLGRRERREQWRQIGC